uniref:Uncharacterized protein n=1 Tax=Panagrolaimus davidi TaxID=227884 RepID=A0A914QI96_9BILA
MSNTTAAVNSLPQFSSTLPYEIVKHILETLWILTTIFNISFAIMFIYFFCKPQNPIRSPYFFLIFETTVIRAISCPIRYPNNHQSTMPFKMPNWYPTLHEMYMGLTMQIHGIIILALALNRLTAFMIPLKHQKLWCGRNFTFLLIFILLYPLLPNLPIAHLFYCYWKLDSDGGYCRANFIGTHKYVYLGNLITPLIAFIMNAIAVKYRFSTTHGSILNHKAEIKLLYQSIFSTVTFTIWTLLNLASYELTPIIRNTPEPDEKDFLMQIRSWTSRIMDLSGILYFEGGLILLFKFSCFY